MRLYIDPGTGSMLFSLCIGLISVLWFGLRKLWMRIKYISPGKVKADRKRMGIVIYSEDKRYWTTFKGILDEFERRGHPVSYLAGSEDDPLLAEPYEYVAKEVLGRGNRAFARLNILNAEICLSTTPGLEVYQWKRSKGVDWYVHIYHSLSVSLGYRMFGTDFYDALLLNGEIQVPYVRKLEEMRKEEAKELVITGSTMMDEQYGRYMERCAGETGGGAEGDGVTVLLAPSWGESSLLVKYGERLIKPLADTGFRIIVRPHPQSYVSDKEVIERLQEDFQGVEWDRDNDGFEAMYQSDILISDFSGIIAEYALIFDRPVLYLNSDVDISCYDAAWVGVEDFTRIQRECGEMIREEDFGRLREIILDAAADNAMRERRNAIRELAWAERGRSAEAVVDYLIEKEAALRDTD